MFALERDCKNKMQVFGEKLRRIGFCKNKNVKCSLIDKLSDSEIKALVNVLYSIQIGNIQIPNNYLRCFRRYSKCLKKLLKKHQNVEQKRKVFKTQKGGFFPLLALLAPVIGGVLAKVGAAAAIAAPIAAKAIAAGAKVQLQGMELVR